MKRFLLCILATMGILPVFHPISAQVSTSVEKKSVLLEEFTGSGCGNCPDGARMASVIKDVCGDQFYIMSIHAGYYAQPVSGWLDLRTPFGDSLLAHATDIGFPSGCINRIPHQGVLNMSRSLWQEKVREELEKDAEVNIFTSAEVDAKTRELKVKVEWYYPAQVDVNPQYLHVALLQDEIIGFQNGAGASYAHQHVLRDMFTGFWGDTIEEIQPGKVYTKEYVKVLPEEISGVDVDVRYLEVVAFITETKDYIMNVCGTHPKVTGLTDAVNVKLEEVDLGTARYGFSGFPVKVRNYQNDTLKDLSFSLEINGGQENAEIACLIPPYSEMEVWVPSSHYTLLPTNEVKISVTEVNGTGYESGSVSYNFSSPVPTKSNKVIIDMKTDLMGGEITYALKDRSGEVIYSNGPFEDGVQHGFFDTLVIAESSVYAIEFLDYWHDGWQIGKKGSYKIKDSEGTILAQNYDVQGYKNLVFFEVSDGLTAEDGIPANSMEVKVISLSDGILISSENVMEEIRVYDIMGRILMKRDLSASGDFYIYSSGWATGWVIVEVRGNLGRTVQKVWLKG